MICNFPKYKCGTIIPSSCVPYTGPALTILPDGEELACDANIDDVFGVFDTAVKTLQTDTDLTGLVLHCLTIVGGVTSFKVHQAQIIKLCEIEADLTALTSQFNALNIGTEEITIDLPACLEAAAAPCATGPNKYQLIALLNLFAAKLCDHETRITNLE